ncbi:formin-1-like isoform X2 [Oscarella lobularis]|uniref:formin-1-like isoform X2 n=1 Tax=Oscarella lobularis TaxID=121494 RepID=UPI003313B23D
MHDSGRWFIKSNIYGRQALHHSTTVSSVMGLVLAIGNHMNAGNSRGMAEAFALDIIPKLKNVKTKDNSSNLLQYVVSVYVRKYDKDAGTSAARCPLPDPADVVDASNLNFEEMEGDINNINKQLEDVEKKATEVFLTSPPDLLQPFKSTMEEFLGWARKTIQNQFDFLSDCKRRFAALVDYYCYRGNGGNGGVVSPSEFFELWTEMCSDFVESRTANGCQENLREEERNVEEIEEE